MTATLPNLTAHKPYQQASATLEKERATLAELESKLAEAQAKQSELETSLGPDQVDKLDTAERDVQRLQRQVSLQERRVREASTAVGDLKPEARKQVRETAQAAYLAQVRTILDCLDTIGAALDQMDAIERDYSRSLAKSPGENVMHHRLQPRKPEWLASAIARRTHWRDEAEKALSRDN